MPRYYFHLRKGDVLTEDQEGTEVSEVEPLEEEAIEFARDLLADGTLQGLDWREWVFEIADAAGATVLTLPFKNYVEADLPASAPLEISPADTPCPHCSGSGTKCEAVCALGEETLVLLKESGARFRDNGSRVDMRCTLCSGSGLVTAKSEADITWSRNLLAENSAAGRRNWSPERREERAMLLRLIRKPTRS